MCYYQMLKWISIKSEGAINALEKLLLPNPCFVSGVSIFNEFRASDMSQNKYALFPVAINRQ